MEQNQSLSPSGTGPEGEYSGELVAPKRSKLASAKMMEQDASEKHRQMVVNSDILIFIY